MANQQEELLDQTLRWMLDNLQGAYTAKFPKGHPKAGQPSVNSGTCILVFCYINALGKVLLKGGPPRRRGGKNVRQDFERFREFLLRCMPDFLSESNKKSLPQTPKGQIGGDEWLYEVFRCGFIHGFYPGISVKWGRKPRLNEYWMKTQPKMALNIDQLVRGFKRGVQEFKRLVEADDNLRVNFKGYILSP